jgi:hypothetical protein
LGCYGVILQIDKGVSDSCDVDIELNGDGALNIYEDAHVVAYM